MDTTHAPGTNGRTRPAKAKPTTPEKSKARKKPRPAAGDAGHEFVYAGYTVERMAAREDALHRMKKCRGYKQIQEVVDAARLLRSLIVDTIQNYGPDSASPTARFLRDFGEFGDEDEDVFHTLLSLAVDLDLKVAVPLSEIPGIR
ncbi:hypothetical protein [Limnoglobus roseus]|uniref:Uncharacterized protein n=1 Tax=Limnoglobus roseus TaxID=2598579 RepID=A0A5C1AA35_9BACT|nr:hypothetical protein [Limnoglobus roseus]QEL15600.1 hypothetical protein PX52LOC_02533 [Limnoglobus roseus]